MVLLPEVVGAVLLAEAAPGDQADAGLLQQPHAVEHVRGLVVLLQEEHQESHETTGSLSHMGKFKCGYEESACVSDWVRKVQ